MTGKRFSTDDGWGRDPSVQGMRRVFAMMEEKQREFLATMGISPLDSRFRAWRQNALRFFEEAWGKAAGRGENLGERRLADLYCACFACILEKAGLSVPPSAFPSDEGAIRIARDVLK
jgi:hypothetical protein